VNFNSHTDAVVTNTVRLVNALTPGEARGRSYAVPPGADRTTAAAEAVRLRGDAELTEQDTDELAKVAAELRVVFDALAGGDVDTAAEQVNRLLAESQARPVLDRHDGQPWHLHFHGVSGEETVANSWAAACATGLAIVLGGELYDRLGVCTAPHCDRVYVDVSRNGTRRFCSTSCQNRVKAAAFRARAADKS
jgi:predicted RNA-binding Zn ribbon-like protein